MLHTDNDAMDMARIGMRDNMVELFVVHKDGATTRKGCTIEEVEDIDGGEAATPTADTIGPGLIVLHRAQLFAQAKVGDDESEDDDYQPENDDEGDIDEQWSENSSGDSDMEVAFDDSDDDWNGDGGKEKVVAAGLRDKDDGYEREELCDVLVSDNERDPLLRKYPLYKSLKNMKDYKWEVGTIYVDRNAFKECVTSYAVHSGRGIWFSKCDSHSKATKIGIMSSQWLSKAFMKKICENPKIKLRTLIKKAHSKWNVDLTKTKAVRVKQQALDEINGTYGEQYRRIHDYAVKLLRWADNRQSIVTYAGEILPKINKKIEREIDKGREWLAIYAGYPCEHAMSCIRKMCLDVKNYVNKCYRKETYVDCYQHVIYPVNGPNLWARTEIDDVLPLVFRKPIGRPKLSRNKTGDEPRNNGPLAKLSRTGQQQNCSYCFALGHNKRTCPRKRKVEASAKKNNAAPQVKKGTGTTRTPNPSKIPAKTITQPATKLQPKRKSNTQVGGSQESQTSSKRARCSSNASQPQPSTATVTSPSRRTLKFMAKHHLGPRKHWDEEHSRF
ncbi:hypothetical protein Ahy_B08g093241 [Arachis hypogaea]|uniref:Transposase MuDR plant domain-containing protein n=1 Tax=Arachis hypogaea TaxID=3818 RepID=A0A444Y5N2_ARAHY|nr:hypothetical protein Ahy_B08g093241 [Arachis hypogaea]